ncbi:MAG TPA: YbhB/YbcL family Raf kinase inhibitor-like protein [Casimicrobiaceae bacterium]|nr:YbhB/YbcL family Raf kinase inhibitor-like protein [Casimicrobiaceae bacterium]
MKSIRATLVSFAMMMLAGYAGAVPMTLRSIEVKPNATITEQHVYKGFGCSGANVSPSLQWKDAPAGTKSFAVTVYDPDAPTGSGWWHWVVFNLPPTTTSLPLGAGDPAANKMPPGAVQSRTDYGAPGYGGPCPPPGDKAHRYIFTVYALKVDKLDLDANASPAMVGFMINANKLGKAQFIGRYGRK